MFKIKNKKGISGTMIGSTVAILVGVIVLFLIAADLVPQAQAAGDSLNASGVPLGSLFAGNGVVFVIIMAALLLAVLAAFKFGGKRGR